MTASAIEIGLVIYPGAQLASVYGLTDLFGVATRIASRNPEQKPELAITVSHWRLQEPGLQPVRVFETETRSRMTPDVLILPPALGEAPSAETASAYSPWLLDQHRQGTILCSICAGAFLLGETGLLSGRSATTHWAHADLFAARFPAAHLDVDKLVIDDGDLITAGGVMAWTDLGLKLVERFLGPTIMAGTARLLVIDPPGREQRFYSSFSPRLTHGDLAVLKVQHWLHATGAKDMSLANLVAQSGLEERTLLRRFQKATGMTTTEYCQRMRISKACELLQTSVTPIETIAWDVGYGDAGAFRKIFLRIVGLTPSDYRQRFNSRRTVTSA